MKGCENAGSDGADIEIAHCLWQPLLLRNGKTILAKQLECLPDAVLTQLYSNPPSPHTMAMLGARERRGMLGLLLQLRYLLIVTFVPPKARTQVRACFAEKTMVRGRFLGQMLGSAPVLPTKPWSAVGFLAKSSGPCGSAPDLP